MRIKSVRLRNYKRFTDLTIAKIPPEARLVVLVGPNGTGKSSVFDLLPAEGKCRCPQLSFVKHVASKMTSSGAEQPLPSDVSMERSDHAEWISDFAVQNIDNARLSAELVLNLLRVPPSGLGIKRIAVGEDDCLV